MNKKNGFLSLLRADPYSPQKKLRFQKIYRVSIVAISIMFLVASFLFTLSQETVIARSSLIYGIVLLIIYVLTKLTRNFSLSRLVIGLVMTSVYTLTFWFGTGKGTGSIWILLLPCISMYLLGFRSGIIMMTYFTILEGACCFIPAVRSMMYFQYSTNYLTILFLALTLNDLFAILTMTAYYRNQLKSKELEEELEKAVLAEHEKLANISLKTILTISNAVEAKDEYTSQHSHRVADFSCMIAGKLGWSDADIAQLRNIALLHDIGKISVKESVLNKPGKLTDDEFAQIKRHTVVGGEILHDLTLIPHVDLGAKFHHERYDSRGYPSGLQGKDIPLEARIIGIADSFDAMRYRRVYRGECDPDYILGELKKGRGTQFDPELLDIFLQVIEEEHLLPEKVD